MDTVSATCFFLDTPIQLFPQITFPAVMSDPKINIILSIILLFFSTFSLLIIEIIWCCSSSPTYQMDSQFQQIIALPVQKKVTVSYTLSSVLYLKI